MTLNGENRQKDEVQIHCDYKHGKKNTTAYGQQCRNLWFIKTTGFLLKVTNNQAQPCRHVSLQMNTAAAD